MQILNESGLRTIAQRFFEYLLIVIICPILFVEGFALAQAGNVSVSISVVELPEGGVSFVGTLMGVNDKPMGGKWIHFYLVSEFFGETQQVLLGRGFTDYLTGEGKLPYTPKFNGPHRIQSEYQEKGTVVASDSNIFVLQDAAGHEGAFDVSSSYLRTLVGFGTIAAIVGVWGTMIGVMAWVVRSIRRSKRKSQ